jgi:hypothetical protein
MKYMTPDQYSPTYAALRDLLWEERKWGNGSVSKASEKRTVDALKRLGLTAEEIEDFWLSQ